MMIKKRLAMAVTVILTVMLLGGCSDSNTSNGSDVQVKLDPSNPVSITVWHYYNGAQQAAFDELISEFNSSEGKDKGIYVEGYSHGSVMDLEKAVTDAAAGAVGSQPLPDIFSSYADTAYSIQKDNKLVDLKKYFTDEELGKYVESYIKDGEFNGDGALYLFPVAKSTEIMMMNATDWQTFADATGATVDELKTTEGVTQVAQRYYEWTDAQTPDVPDDGKAFYGRDSMSNYFVIGMKQMGVDIFDVNDGKVTLRTDKDKIRRLWDNYYVPYISGYFVKLGKFSSDDVKTGDILAYTGSSSSAMYFPDQAMKDDESRPIDYMILPAPVMEGGTPVCVQQSASMAVTKSDPQHEYAACEFLKWFTAKNNNLRFVCESAYLPVLKEANTVEALDSVIAEYNLNVKPKAYDCLKSIISTFDSTEFYATKCFDNGYATRKVLDYNLSDKAVADRAYVDQAVSGGTPRAEAVAMFNTDECFEAWYNDFCSALEEKANG